MKKRISTLAALMCLILIGCTANGNKDQSSIPEETTEPQETAVQTTEPPKPVFAATCLPVISIETVSQESGVMDFVTKPVAAHVSEQVASWTPGYIMPPAPYYEDCKVTVMMPNETEPALTSEAKVKVRGNWTTNYDKKPLRIKFNKKQNMLGLNDGAELKNWVLLAEYKDASMLRDKAMLEIADGIQKPDALYVSDTMLAEVQINGQYWGVYLLAEQQEVDEDRVDITNPKKDDQGTNIGYFLEFDGYYYNEDPLNAFHVDYAGNAPLKPYDGADGSGKTMTCLPEDQFNYKKDIGITIKSEIYSQQQHDFIADYTNLVYRIMYAAAYENKAYVFNDSFTEITPTNELTPQQAVEKVVNVNSLADAYIINEIACDADIYWSSFFMSADFGENGDKKLTFQAPWDFDSALGNKDRCADGTGFYAANIVPDVNGNEYETINPWLAVLMYQDWYQDIIRQKWTAAYDSGIYQKAIENVRSDTKNYADAFQRNNDKWGISTKDDAILFELERNAASCHSQESAAEYLANWLEARIAFLNSKWHS